MPLPARSADAHDWARVAEQIRKRRAELDITQEELGVSKAVANALENGRQQSFSARTLTRVERALGWATGSIEIILSGGEPVRAEQPDDRTFEERLSAVEAEIDQLWSAVSPDDTFSRRRDEARRQNRPSA